MMARLLLRAGLLRGASGENRVLPAIATREQNGERNGDQHKNNRAPGGEFSQQIGGAAGAEGRLRTLPAERAGQVGRFALLQQDYTDQEQTDDDVNDDKKDDHRKCFCDLGELGFGGETRREPGVSGGKSRLVRRDELEPLCLAAQSS
jgi:hypothetical protein